MLPERIKLSCHHSYPGYRAFLIVIKKGYTFATLYLFFQEINCDSLILVYFHQMTKDLKEKETILVIQRLSVYICDLILEMDAVELVKKGQSFQFLDILFLCYHLCFFF